MKHGFQERFNLVPLDSDRNGTFRKRENEERTEERKKERSLLSCPPLYLLGLYNGGGEVYAGLLSFFLLCLSLLPSRSF